MVTREPAPYTGRFAPSPTGPLHFGSLVAAVASYLQARSRGGKWLLRIEDIDPPREQPGASEAIIAALAHCGFEWDGPVLYQSQSHDAHHRALRQLVADGHAYRCDCSRADLADLPRGPLGPIYPGTCRAGCDADEAAVRVRTCDDPLAFEDAVQGRYCQRLESESGDFVICRRDGLIAYHLAVVVDDALQGITEVVRGMDLLDSTPRQIWLQRLLGYRTPEYAHIPLVLGPDGTKLSKSLGAGAADIAHPAKAVVAALKALNQSPPAELERASLAETWAWATAHWQLQALVGVTSIAAPEAPDSP